MPRSHTTRVVLAWAVHAFTITGVFWACFAVVALFDGNIKGMWLWLGIALIVDGVDGTMARKANVKKEDAVSTTTSTPSPSATAFPSKEIRA